MRGKVLSALLLFFFLSWVHAQDDRIDKLKADISKLKEDSAIVLALKDISFFYQYSQPDSGLYFARRCIELATRINWKKGIASGYNSLGVNFLAKGNYKEAMKAHESALALRTAMGDLKAIAASNGNIGIIYERLANFPQALKFQQYAQRAFIKLNDQFLIGLSNINVGNVLMKMTMFEKAKMEFSSALYIAENIKNPELEMLALANLGPAFRALNDLLKAESSLKRCLKISTELNNLNVSLNTLGNLGLIYEDRDLLDTALSQYNKAHELAHSFGDLLSEANALNSMANIYLKKGKTNISIQFCKQALGIANQINSIEVKKEGCRILSNAYLVEKNYSAALTSYKDFVFLKDSIFSETSLKKVNSMELQYQFEKELEKRTLAESKRKELADAELNKQKLIRNISIGFCFVVILLGIFVWKNYIDKRNANRELTQKNATIIHQKKEITDSINYAQRIQQAILPEQKEFSELFSDSFVLYLPKDIVSGDFYYAAQIGNRRMVAVGDCTGHGVPGAFMSLIGSKELKLAMEQEESPSKILRNLNNGIKKTLKQNERLGIRDGMDIALCCFENNRLSVASANRPVYIYKKSTSEIGEIKGTKSAIGGLTDFDFLFEEHELKLDTGDIVYLFSDGYADQFGGVNGKKLTTKKFRSFLIQISQESMKTQEEKLSEFFNEWKSNTEQIDDVLVVGIKFV